MIQPGAAPGADVAERAGHVQRSPGARGICFAMSDRVSVSDVPAIPTT